MRSWAVRFRTSVEDLVPEQIALLLSLGLVLGVFPIMGVPTVLCLLAAFAFRLHVAPLQLLNNLSSPLQLVLLIPLERAGACLCGGAVAGSGSMAGRIGVAAIHAVTAWACFCVPSGVLLYFVLIMAMRGRRLPWSKSAETTAY